MTSTAAPATAIRLRAVTREVAPIEDVLACAAADSPLYWMRRGDGIAGVGIAARLVDDTRGGAPGDRVGRLSERWRALTGAASVDDEVRLPGTGLVAFGAFAFDAASARPSTLIVPRVILGRRGTTSWITHITVDDDDATTPVATDYGPHWSATVGPGALDPDGYQRAVTAALDAIAAGEVGKVVLARDVVGTVPAGSDLRRLARALTSSYPDCWTYAVDGIIGASPETLVTVSGGTMTARVLAGTAARGADADADTAASLGLATSAKDQDEHLYAVQSVLGALRPHTSALAASEQPFMLKLPNVWHLATDVEGELAHGEFALELVRALHPTAAVAGTPTPAALDVIRRLEPFDRGRYAGPVGWVDAHGDGEWAIALRCAQFDLPPAGAEASTIALTAHAGAGIVAGSDPETELLETRVKFRPIVDALA